MELVERENMGEEKKGGPLSAGPIAPAADDCHNYKHPQVIEFDPDNRDPYQMNQFLRLSFMDIIAEPDENTHSGEGVYRCSYKCFKGTKSCWYRFLTMCCAVPISFCLGLQFACVSFTWIWCLRPKIKGFELFMIYFQKIYGAMIRATVMPLFAAVGYIFSKIRLTTATTTEVRPLLDDV